MVMKESGMIIESIIQECYERYAFLKNISWVTTEDYAKWFLSFVIAYYSSIYVKSFANKAW